MIFHNVKLRFLKPINLISVDFPSGLKIDSLSVSFTEELLDSLYKYYDIEHLENYLEIQINEVPQSTFIKLRRLDEQYFLSLHQQKNKMIC